MQEKVFHCKEAHEFSFVWMAVFRPRAQQV